MTANAEKIVELKNGRTRRFRSKEERRQIVEETLMPSASVSEVARAYGVNTNQVFKWRRQYRQGRLEINPSTALLPVKVCDVVPEVRRPERRSRKSKAQKSGIIDIDLGHARVRIEGVADPECIRAALEGLVR
jgi:transposase